MTEKDDWQSLPSAFYIINFKPASSATVLYSAQSVYQTHSFRQFTASLCDPPATRHYLWTPGRAERVKHTTSPGDICAHQWPVCAGLCRRYAEGTIFSHPESASMPGAASTVEERALTPELVQEFIGPGQARSGSPSLAGEKCRENGRGQPSGGGHVSPSRS